MDQQQQQQQLASKRRHNKQSTQNALKPQNMRIYGLEKPLPPCSCGARRLFHFQLLPSLLHVLQVDKYVRDSTVGDRNWSETYESGGMDWGNIAVYTCSARCDSEEAYCVIQDSVDGRPSRQQQMKNHAEDVVIQEDAIFNADDDDENDEDDDEDEDEEGMGGCEMQDDEDDDSVFGRYHSFF